MGNVEHVAWLLEGVERWNARREQMDFVPDFEGERPLRVIPEREQAK